MGSEDAKKASAGTSLRSDEPNRTQEQDRLARAHLVEVIGKHILYSDASESVIIALNALFHWLRWSHETTVRAAVGTQVQSDESLVVFVGMFVSKSHSHSMGDKVARTHIVFDKKCVEAFIDLDATLARLRSLAKKDGDLAVAAQGLVEFLEKKSERLWEQ